MRRAFLGGLLALASVLAISGAAQPSTAAQSFTAAQPGDLDGFEYVALGDSYSAGFGLDPYSTSSPFAGSPNGCYQAQANYPHHVASALGLAITDQTCSGAITSNVGYASGVSFPSTVPAKPLPVLPTGDELQVTLSGMTAPELQFAGLSETTDVVTVGIGGNDLGFSHIAEACIRDSVSPSSVPYFLYWVVGVDVPNCADYFGDGATYPDADLFARMTDVVAPRIEATLDAVKQLAPNAQVFVVGYPQVTPSDATNACFTAIGAANAVPFSGVDLQFIHSVEVALDGALRTGAANHDFTYVSTWKSSGANTLCSDDPWIWGLTAYMNSQSTCDANYLPVLDGEACVELGALHPNEKGIADLASATTSAVNNAFFVRPADATAQQTRSTAVTGGGFYPAEVVRIELRSGSTSLPLGTTTADSTGAFATTVVIPANAPAGAAMIAGVGATSNRSFSAPLEVTASLAPTGTSPAPIVLAGGLLLLLGTALVLALRMRDGRARG